MKKILLMVPLFLIMVFVAGCSGAALSNPVSGKIDVPDSSMKDTSELPPADEIINKDSMSGAGAGESITVVLFFADSSGYLAPERREIPKVAGIARETMIQLCRGPSPENGLMPTIPPGVEVKSIKIEDGLATVDFSGELKKNHWGGSSGEMLTVYSIVNTLTQFSTVKRVQILVDGKIMDTLAGHLDTRKPLERDSGMVKGSK